VYTFILQMTFSLLVTSHLYFKVHHCKYMSILFWVFSFRLYMQIFSVEDGRDQITSKFVIIII